MDSLGAAGLRKVATALDSTFLQLLRMTERASPSKAALSFPRVTTNPTSTAPKVNPLTPRLWANKLDDAKAAVHQAGEDVVIMAAVDAAAVVVIGTAAAVAVVAVAEFASVDKVDKEEETQVSSSCFALSQ